MNYHGENWEIGDTLVHLVDKYKDYKFILLEHAQSTSHQLSKRNRVYADDPDRTRIDPGFVALYIKGGTLDGTVGQEDPKYLTKLLPPAIETQKTQDAPVDEEELLKAA